MEIVRIIEDILEDLTLELQDLHDEVFLTHICNRRWEKNLQKYDELLIRKIQTQQILDEIKKRGYYEQPNPKNI